MAILECVAREEITVSSTAKELTSSYYARTPTGGAAYDVIYADITVQGANIRTTLDGDTTATTNIGRIWYAGGTYRVWGNLNLSRLSMIRDDATDAEVVVEYWGRRGR